MEKRNEKEKSSFGERFVVLLVEKRSLHAKWAPRVKSSF
jgi:hypothetical protein